VPAAATPNVRNDMYLVSDAVRVMGASPPRFSTEDVNKLKVSDALSPLDCQRFRMDDRAANSTA
jgi:hypothetical protein